MLGNVGCTRILMLHRVLPAAPAAFGLPDCYRMRGTALTASELARVLDEARMPDVLIGLRKPHRLRFSEESDVLTGRTLATSVIPSSPIPLLLKLTSLSKGH